MSDPFTRNDLEAERFEQSSSSFPLHPYYIRLVMFKDNVLILGPQISISYHVLNMDQ